MSATASVFTETLDTNTSGFTLNTIRAILSPANLSNVPPTTITQCRVALTAGSTNFQIGAAYIGHQAGSGDEYDFAATPVQLTWSASGSTTIPTGTTVYSDWVPFVWDKTSSIIVSVYISGNASNDDFGSKITNGLYRAFFKAGNDASTVNATGYGHFGGSDANNDHTFVADIQMDGFYFTLTGASVFASPVIV